MFSTKEELEQYCSTHDIKEDLNSLYSIQQKNVNNGEASDPTEPDQGETRRSNLVSLFSFESRIFTINDC